MTRLALGADRTHIVRLRMVELLIIAAAGGVAGLSAARGGLALLYSTAPDLVRGASFDWVVVSMAGGTAVLAAILAGVPTAMQEATFTVSGLAGTASKTTGGSGERRRRSVLLVSQVALAVVMLAGPVLATPQQPAAVQVEKSPVRQPASSAELEQYAARERVAEKLEKFEGGRGRGVQMGTVIVILLLVIIILLILIAVGVAVAKKVRDA